MPVVKRYSFFCMAQNGLEDQALAKKFDKDWKNFTDRTCFTFPPFY